MEPKTLLVHALELDVVPVLMQYNFVWSRSEMRLKRARGDFTDEVKFHRSTLNRRGTCEFWSSWSVRSKAFHSWYRKVWSRSPSDDFVVATNDWLISGWPRSGEGFLLNGDAAHDAAETKSFLRAAITLGIPFLDCHLTVVDGANFWLSRKTRLDRTIDLLVMCGQTDRARQLFELRKYEVLLQGSADDVEWLSEFTRATSRYFT